MVLRATNKLARKLKIQSLQKYGQKVSAFEEWYGHLFTADRIQYILLTNAYSLYSCVFPAKGVTTLRAFADLSGYWLTEVIKNDGCDDIIRRIVIQSYETIDVYATNNKGVLGSMNDMIANSKFYLSEYNLNPIKISKQLNDMPFGYLKYKNPSVVINEMERS
jgi:hypothetical protein